MNWELAMVPVFKILLTLSYLQIEGNAILSLKMKRLRHRNTRREVLLVRGNQRVNPGSLLQSQHWVLWTLSCLHLPCVGELAWFSKAGERRSHQEAL